MKVFPFAVREGSFTDPLCTAHSFWFWWDQSVMGGIASVVEAGAITALVALFTGVFVYRTIRWKECTSAFRRAFRNSAMVFIIIAASGPFSWLLTSLGAISDLENWLLGMADSPVAFVLALILFIFLLGTVMDSAVNIIIVGPVLVDVMAKAGFHESSGRSSCDSWLFNRLRDPACWCRLFYVRHDCRSSFGEGRSRINSLSCGLFLLLFFIIVIPELTMFLPDLMNGKV